MKDREKKAFGRLLEVMDELREKCPWDREQTIESLRINTIEEVYELIDAITEGDYSAIREELGDLLLHVVFYSKIAEEEGEFNIEDVINTLNEKLIFRHPHVFADGEAENTEEVKYSWEQQKLKERKQRRGVLDGVPMSLPAMVKAYRVGEKAAAVGFDWEKREDVWEKAKEEIAEVEQEMAKLVQDPNDEEAQRRMESEFGDLIFSIINASRLYGVDPELALDRCNKKFISRFNEVEKSAERAGSPIQEFSLVQLEEWWQAAKKSE